jgi:hypothetical protein
VFQQENTDTINMARPDGSSLTQRRTLLMDLQLNADALVEP